MHACVLLLQARGVAGDKRERMPSGSCSACVATPPESLQVLLYNPLRGTPWLSKACAALMFLSFFFGITAVALMWRTSPNEYPYGGLLNDSMYFFRCLPC